MITIHKFPLFGVFALRSTPMPKGAVVLSVHVQQGTPVAWALVDTDQAHVTRKLRFFGTGHRMDEDMPPGDTAPKFVGTVQLHEGTLVLHLFDFGEA